MRAPQTAPARASTGLAGTSFHAPVAQLDRASGYEPEGREFESLRARQVFESTKNFGGLRDPGAEVAS